MSKNGFDRAINLEPRFDELEYFLLPNRFSTGFALLELYNQAYHYWETFWTDVLRSNGSPHSIEPADFLRVDYVGILVAKKQKIAALQLHTVLNLEQAPMQFHPYIATQPADLFLREAERTRSRSAMTVEYLTVDPAWRKSVTGVSLGRILLGLAVRQQRELGIEIGFFKARQDVKVSDYVAENGASVLKANIDMHNTPVSFLALTSSEIKEHPEPEIREHCDRLWRLRSDLSNQRTNASSSIKAA